MDIKGIKYTGPIFDNCYDNKTEVLTGGGWKYFKDVMYNDVMCTLNKKQVIEFHKPDDIINKEYNGDMYHFVSKQSKIDLLVTPNHNMYTQTEASRKADKVHESYIKEYGVEKIGENSWYFEKASSIVGKTRYFKKDADYLMKGPKYFNIRGRDVLAADWLEFLGYYLSEGSSTITKRKNYIVQIRQYGKELSIMAEALRKVTPNKLNIKESDGRVIVNDKSLCLYLKNTFGDVYTKYIPRDILNKCSRTQLLILFDALMLGDGHNLRDNYKNGLVSGGSSYHTASVALKDNFMELALKVGFSASAIIKFKKGTKIKIYNRECIAGADNWSILIRFSNNICVYNQKNNFECNTRKYKGSIHCVTVKNHTLYVRRNGCPVWSGNSGYAKACRGNILALYHAGVPITLNPISFEQAHPDLGGNTALLKSLVHKTIDYNVNLMHTTPEFWSKHKEHTPYNIGYTIWETTKLHKDWPGYINSNVEKVLVGCEWNRDIFKDSGVTVPIGVVPHGTSVKEFNDVAPFQIAGVKETDFVFYSIFQWTERKCPLALLKAYYHAFQNNEDVVLVLKAYGNDYTTKQKESIVNAIKHLKWNMPMPHFPKVILIGDMISEDEMASVHARGDCYVSLDRGEGFGLSPFTAGAAGNPIIVTGFGGSTEYAKEDNSYLVDYMLTPVYGMPWSPWYDGTQLWAEPNVVDGSAKMKHVYENREEAKTKGLKLQDSITKNFSWEAIADRIITEIREIN